MTGGSFYVIKKSGLQKLLDSLSRRMTVFVPVKGPDDYNFREMKPGNSLNIDGYENTEFPPRMIFMPDRETILEYEKNSAKAPAEARTAVFGIRPCDVHALNILDKVMLGHDYREEHYGKKRERSVVMALACRKAGENCFCGSMGTDAVKEGFDLLFTEQGDGYHVAAGSEKGERIVAENKRLFRKTDDEAKKIRIRCKKNMNIENLPEIMKDMRDSKIWQDVAGRCLSCASCTFSCPTCYCFSLTHESDIANPDRARVLREMDYCMLVRFSRVAGGFVFRKERNERVKQFFYHKLLYGYNNEGALHCVGCGRCISECMAKIDITEEVRKVREEHGRKK